MNSLLIITLASFAFVAQGDAADLKLPRDGWASWQVEAVEDAPAMCCWSGRERQSSETASCNLDGEHRNFGSRDHETTDAVRVYAKFANGKLERLRTLAASCPVQSKTSIQKLEGIATDDSARWLTGFRREDLGEEVLVSLAMHRGAVAFDALSKLARNDKSSDTRQHAIFWLAEARGSAGAEIVTDAMFTDKDADVRKHAAFAITVSKSPRIAAELTKLGNTDADGEVRAQAWFWLAHTGASGAEDAIRAALQKDRDDHVREQAIFALSQLPDDRATRALIAAAEDRSLDREQRKRAVFWLGQSESTDAQAYLDKVLARNP